MSTVYPHLGELCGHSSTGAPRRQQQTIRQKAVEKKRLSVPKRSFTTEAGIGRLVPLPDYLKRFVWLKTMPGYLVPPELVWAGRPWAARQAWRVARVRVEVQVAAVAAAVAAAAAAALWWESDTSLWPPARWAYLCSPEPVEKPTRGIRNMRKYIWDGSEKTDQGTVTKPSVSDSKTENHYAWKISHQRKNIIPGITNWKDSCVFIMSWSRNRFVGVVGTVVFIWLVYERQRKSGW